MASFAFGGGAVLQVLVLYCGHMFLLHLMRIHLVCGRVGFNAFMGLLQRVPLCDATFGVFGILSDFIRLKKYMANRMSEYLALNALGTKKSYSYNNPEPG